MGEGPRNFAPKTHWRSKPNGNREQVSTGIKKKEKGERIPNRCGPKRSRGILGRTNR